MPVYHDKGDALRAEKIAVAAQSIDTTRVIKRTHSHKGHVATARGNAYCVIEIPLKAFLNKK